MEKTRKVPEWLKPIFWDVEIMELDVKQHQVFIIRPWSAKLIIAVVLLLYSAHLFLDF